MHSLSCCRYFPAFAAALVGLLVAFSASGQAYPSKPIRLVIPFGAGSTADIIGRLVGEGLSRDLGQQVVVDNKPGAGGTIGAADVARAAPDGYSLVLGTVASHGVGPLTMQNVTYDPVKHFQPITLIANVPSIIAVHASVPVQTLDELVAFLKANPGYHFTSAGPGTTAHLAGESFAQKLGLKLEHVPYKAAGQAIADTVAGTVKMIVYQYASLKSHIEAGVLRPIAAVSAERIPALPNVPTVAEALVPGFDFSPWFGIMAPAGTPRHIVDTLHGAVLKAIESEGMKNQFRAQGMHPVGLGPDAFHDFMRRDLERWKDVIARSGLKP